MVHSWRGYLKLSFIALRSSLFGLEFQNWSIEKERYECVCVCVRDLARGGLFNGLDGWLHFALNDDSYL